MLTHNGFVTEFRKYGKQVEDDIQSQLKEIGTEFELEYQRKHQMDFEDEGTIEDYVEDHDERNPLCPVKG